MECLVIGLGVFGKSVVESLKSQGISIVGIDINQKALQEMDHLLDESLNIDTTVESQLRQVGVEHFDYCFLCIGEGIEASLTTAMHLNSLGASRVIARSLSHMHEALLEKLGIYKIVNPEKEIGIQLIREITSNLEYFVKIKGEMAITSVMIPSGMVGKTLRSLDLRTKFHINILWIEKQVPFVGSNGKETVYSEINDTVGPDYVFNAFDKITFIASYRNINKFLDYFKITTLSTNMKTLYENQ